MSKVGHILNENFNFWGHLSIFGAENILKSVSFKTKKKAWTVPKQLLKNFEKS